MTPHAAPVGLDLDALRERWRFRTTPTYTQTECAYDDIHALLDLVSRQAQVIEAARLVWSEGSAAGLDKTMGLYKLGPALADFDHARSLLPGEPET